jgi:hypothetical protein
MGQLQLGRAFTAQEVNDIVAFLKTLAGKQPDFKQPILPPSTHDTPKPKPFADPRMQIRPLESGRIFWPARPWFLGGTGLTKAG